LSIAIRLEIDVQQMALDRLVLPIDDHGLGVLTAIQREIKNGVVAAFRAQNAQHVPRIYAHCQCVLASAIHDGGNLAFTPHPACLILGASFPRIRFQNVLFQCGCHDFNSLRK
jgi:hypothetical protein